MLQLKNLTLFHKTNKTQVKEICSNISLQLPAKSVWMICGKNGSGKSTLLHTIAGLHPYFSGEIIIYRQAVQQTNPKLVSMVFSQAPAIPLFTVEDTLKTNFATQISSWNYITNNYPEEKVDELLHQFHLYELKNRYFDSLSDGEKQKIMIARSLLTQPKVLLLDEPLAFLDYPSRIELLQMLRRISQEKEMTIAFSTHDIEISLPFASTVSIINKLGFVQHFQNEGEIRNLEAKQLFEL